MNPTTFRDLWSLGENMYYWVNRGTTDCHIPMVKTSLRTLPENRKKTKL